MKTTHRFILLTGILACCLPASLWATATNSTLASASISAGTARIGGSGAYTSLTGPAISESDSTGLPVGSMILNAPPGWEFGTNANSVTITVTGIGGTDALINTNNSTTGQGSSKTVTPTTNSITIWVTTASSTTSARSVLTWSGINVRPVNVTPLSTGTITCSGTSGGIGAGVNNGTLTEVGGAASKLAITQSPATNFAASSLTPAVQVQVQDQFGNIVGTNGVSITVSLDHGSFDFGGTTASTVGTNGYVVFSTLQINTATNYFLNASASGLSNAVPVPLTIIPLPASSIQFLQDAPSNAVVSSIFSPPVTVRVTDPFNNAIGNMTVNMSLIGGGSLSGTVSQVTSGSGVATFGDLSTSAAGSNKSLVASIASPSLSATGITFSVGAGSATKLGYTIAPATTTAGVTMASITVQVQDQAGNSYPTNGVPINIALNTGAFASGTTNLTTGVDGSVTFTDLVINVAGNYTLTASAPTTSLSSTPAAAFSIVPGPVSTFQFTQYAPPSVIAGATFSPAVTVQLSDAFSNPISNKTVTLSLNGGGPLNGTNPRATSGSGVATFNDLSVNVAGTNYSLTASVTGPAMSITGATFVVTAAAPTKLGYTVALPVTNAPGVILPTFVVQVQDQFNNGISTSGVPIAVNLNTGNFTSGTSNINSAADGSATFNDLLLNAAGTYTLTASAPGLTSAGRSLVITNGPVTVFQFTQDAPASIPAGTTFSPPVTVRVADAFNNPYTNKTVTLTLNAGGPLLGTTSLPTSGSGVATYTNLSINVTGNSYALIANITGPAMSVTGSTFVVTNGAPSKVIFSTLPATTNTAGMTMATFVVRVQDQFSNNVLTNGVPIRIVLNTGSFASGTSNLNTVADGSATFTDLVINAAGPYTMSAMSTGLTSAARLITVVPGPYAITFQQDAPSLTTAGVIFSPAVAVKIADAFNNVLSNTTVSLTLNGGGALSGTTSRLTTNTGVATFTNLSVNVAGTNYSLTASITSPALSVTGGTFVVNAAAATKLAFSTTPVTTNTAGQTLPTFVVQIRDAFNNNISTSGVPVTIGLNSGTFASGTSTTNTLADGSATFSDLVITNAGNNTLTASAVGLTSTNKAITVLPAAYAITFQQDAPSPATAGTIFAPPVAVRIADAFNNVLSNTAVALTLNGGGALIGTTSRLTTNTGVATFTNLAINVAGTNYSLTASVTSPALSVTGNVFSVNAAAATKLAFSTAPVATSTAGQTLPNFVVQIRDAFNNNISTSDVPITISLSTGTFASGTPTTNTLADGSATFGDLVITNSGNNTLTASATGLTSTNKAITILADTANAIAFVQGPAASISAGSVFTNTVKIVDQFNNGISNATVTLAPNGFATLNGTLSRTTAGNGVATFNNLSVNTPGTGYSITATSGSLSTTSTTFNVTVGAIDHYVVSANSNQTRGAAFPVTVTAQDIVSNTVPDNSTVVTMSSSSANVTFDVNPQTLSSGTFVVNAQDNIPETISIIAQDANGKAGTNSAIVVGAAAGDFRSATNGNWNVTGTWQTWDGANWVAASTTPAGGAGTNITVQSTHLVTNNVAVALTGTLITQGTLTFSGGSISVGSGGIMRNSGTMNNSSTSVLIFNSGATYQNAFTTGAGTIPTAQWNAGSTCAVIGYTSNSSSPGGLAQSFYHFTWNCPGQTTTISLGGTLTTVNGDFTLASSGSGTLQGSSFSGLNLTVAGNMNLQAGRFIGSSSGGGNLRIGGNYVQTGGTLQNGSSAMTVNFTGANKSFIRSGGTLNSAAINFAVTNAASLSLSNDLAVSTGQSFTVQNGGTLYCGTNIINGAGTFALSAGGTLGIGSAAGITASAAAGNIQTTTRTFNIGGTYLYNGAIAQTTSNGLPATVRSLIVSNTASTVTLSANVAISNDLQIVAGTLDLGSFTANRVTSGGTNLVANGATMKIGGTNTLPSNYATRLFGATSTIEYEGVAQNLSAQSYGNLTTSGSNTKTLQAGTTAIAGNLTIGSSTTLDTGTNNFSLAGNLTDNGALYTYAGPQQIITFNGASPQTIGGTSSPAFNTVAINSGSVLNLANTSTALTLLITNVSQAAGTWGATGSGAANIDDTYFQGTGTLQVLPPSYGLTILQDAPASVTAGVTFSPAVTVQLTSSVAGLTSNKTVTLTLNGGGTLNGTLSQLTDTNGVAAFTNLNVTTAGMNYTLTASISSLSLSTTGSTFVVNADVASRLVYSVLPVATNVAGTTLPTFVVQMQDTFSNNVASGGVPITMTLSTGSFASGTTNLTTDVDGSATFFDLVINSAGTRTMSATSPGLTSAARSITILPGTYAITFQQDAPSPATAGTVFAPPVVVKIADPFNNVLSNTTVTLTLNGGGTLNGTTSRLTTNTGVATFTNLTINVAGTNYSLTASVTSPALSVTGNVFTVNAAAATKLAFSTAPVATITAGQTLPTFVVQMRDAFNNNISTSDVPITISLNTGTFASGTATTNSLADGSATFSDLVITNSGNNILTASATGLTSTNKAITIIPDVATNITFVQNPPASVGAGSLFTNTIKVVDQFNNGISNVTVTLAPVGFATLNGTLSRATAGNGVATFTNLSVNTIGTGYSITATAASLSTTSTTFNVTVGAIDHYVVAANSNQTRGVAFPVTVTAKDVVSNTVPDNSTVVTMSSSSANVTFDVNPQTLSNGTFIVNALDGVVGSISLYAQDANGKAGTNSTIVINTAAGDYRSATNGAWSNIATWQVWDGASWVAASVAPAGGTGTNITVQSGHTVTNDTALSLAGTLFTQGSLTNLTAGTITVGSSGVVRNSGTILSTTNNLIFAAGAIYQHAFTTTAGTIPTAAWNANSTCAIVGYTTYGTANSPPGNLAQAFGNFTWNCPSQSGTITLHGDLATVNGNFNVLSTGTGYLFGRISGDGTTLGLTVRSNLVVQSGSFTINGGGTAGTLTIGGSYNQSGGTIAAINTGGTTVNFIGAGKTYTQSAGTLNTSLMNLVVSNAAALALNNGVTMPSGQSFSVATGGTLLCGTNVINGAGSFVLNAGGTLGIGSPVGLTAAGTAAGNIQTTTRTLNIGGIYLYNGNVAQTASNGMPATVRSLIVSNTASTVTLGSNVTVSNDLRVLSGTLDLGSFIANRATSGGTNTVVNGATMKVGGTNTLPANYATSLFGAASTIEYEGAAQNIAAATYGHLTTSGSSTKTLQAGTTAIAGNLTIGSGTTLDAGANNFSLAGNWINNGSGFTASGSQTVTFNGASPQTISGTPMTFNNVAINSGSVLNLAYAGTANANALSIGGTSKLAGTWGATGSGATFIDDTDFQGTGVLNVLTGPTGNTLLSSTLNPATYGQSITFTAQVVAVGAPPPATGTITFMEGANTLGSVALSGSPTGIATFATSSFAPGTYAITAVYGGDSNFGGSTSAVLSQQVNTASLLITANNTNKTYGQTVTFAGTEFTATGLLGTDSVSSVTLSSAGTVSSANFGSYNIMPSSAVGYDLSHYSITYSNGTLAVNQTSSSIAVSSSVNPVCQSTPVYFTANVTSGAGTPSGSVQFKIDAIDFGSPASLVGGIATSAVTSALSAGNHVITAVYSGDINFTGSTSLDYTQSVTAAPAAPSASNNGPLCEGSTLQLTASFRLLATYSWTGPNGFTSSSRIPVISNATTAATGAYNVTLTVNGCTSTSATTVVTVNAIPAAPIAANDGPTCVGGILNLSASSVSNATYAWSGPNAFSSSDQNPVLSNVTTAAAGNYNVIVAVNGCTSTAATTLVSISTPPNISTNPAPLTVNAGQPASFSVVATGTGLTYQWRKDTTNVTGAVSNNLYIASTTAADAGDYDVIVAGTCGVVTSSVAHLTVITLTPFQQWQFQYFGSTNSASSLPTADPDADGKNNQAEFDSGTNPTNSASYLHITSLLRQGSDFVITWMTAGGRTNVVQFTTGSGYNTNFVDLGGSTTIITGSGDQTTNYTDTGAATNAVPRFYRIRLVP